MVRTSVAGKTSHIEIQIFHKEHNTYMYVEISQKQIEQFRGSQVMKSILKVDFLITGKFTKHIGLNQ